MASRDARPTPIRVLGSLALAGAALHAGKGLALLLGGPDLSFVPAFTLLFAVGMLGLYLLLGDRERALGTAGAAALVVAAFGAAAGLAFQAIGAAPEDPAAPPGVGLAYLVAMLGILVGLLLLGIATYRARAVAGGWRAVPLAVGVAWFPLEGLTAVLPDGSGLVAAGIAWGLAALALVVAPVPSRRPLRPTVSPPR